MKSKYFGWLVLLGVVVALAAVTAACTGADGPPGADGKDAAATCNQCHNDTTLVLSKQIQSAQQGHVAGDDSYVRGTRASCAGCHASDGFTARIDAGIAAADVEEGIANPTPPNCRTCHEIHMSYTSADWALTTTAPVAITATGGTYDRGGGNLCANCHQARRGMADVGFGDGADVTVTSTHWGPHHGVEANIFVGEGGYNVSDNSSIHYMMVEEGCPTCHMVDGGHTLEADVAGCASCHADLDTFDYKGVQTDVQAMYDELAELLEHEGLLHDGHPVADAVGSEAAVGALWNYMLVYEDGSLGVHNPAYVKALLEAGIDALK
jgi:hypothetical protein